MTLYAGTGLTRGLLIVVYCIGCADSKVVIRAEDIGFQLVTLSAKVAPVSPGCTHAKETVAGVPFHVHRGFSEPAGLPRVPLMGIVAGGTVNRTVDVVPCAITTVQRQVRICIDTGQVDMKGMAVLSGQLLCRGTGFLMTTQALRLNALA